MLCLVSHLRHLSGLDIGWHLAAGFAVLVVGGCVPALGSGAFVEASAPVWKRSIGSVFETGKGAGLRSRGLTAGLACQEG